MKTFMSHALRARRFYPHATRRQAAKQAVAYAKAVQFLGDKWILVKQAKRLETARPV